MLHATPSSSRDGIISYERVISCIRERTRLKKDRVHVTVVHGVYSSCSDPFKSQKDLHRTVVLTDNSVTNSINL